MKLNLLVVVDRTLASSMAGCPSNGQYHSGGYVRSVKLDRVRLKKFVVGVTAWSDDHWAAMVKEKIAVLTNAKL